MLVLSRKLNQEIRISEDIVVRIVGIKGSQVRLGIVAPKDVAIVREEIVTKVRPPVRQSCSQQRLTKGAPC